MRIAVFYLGLLGAWQLIYLAEVWAPYVFPGPRDVYEALRYNIENGDLWEAGKVTIQRMAIGYSLSIVIGLAVGVAVGSLRWVDETIGSLVLGLQSLPSVTWFPLALPERTEP